MTPQQYADKLRSQLTEILTRNAPFEKAVFATQAEAADRIFTDGITADKKQFHYTSNSYLNYRVKRGRQVSYVDFNLEGDLFSNFTTGVQRVSVNDYDVVLRDENVRKYEGLKVASKKGTRPAYGEFLNISKEEQTKMAELIEKELKALLSR